MKTKPWENINDCWIFWFVIVDGLLRIKEGVAILQWYCVIRHYISSMIVFIFYSFFLPWVVHTENDFRVGLCISFSLAVSSVKCIITCQNLVSLGSFLRWFFLTFGISVQVHYPLANFFLGQYLPYRKIPPF